LFAGRRNPSFCSGRGDTKNGSRNPPSWPVRSPRRLRRSIVQRRSRGRSPFLRGQRLVSGASIAQDFSEFGFHQLRVSRLSPAAGKKIAPPLLSSPGDGLQVPPPPPQIRLKGISARARRIALVAVASRALLAFREGIVGFSISTPPPPPRGEEKVSRNVTGRKAFVAFSIKGETARGSCQDSNYRHAAVPEGPSARFPGSVKSP